MSHPRVISLGFAVPRHCVTQEEALRYFGWKSPLTRNIFEQTGIAQRYSYIDPARFAGGLSWQDLCDEYERGALELGVKAAHGALDSHSVKDIGLITFASVSGFTVPSMSYPLAAALRLRGDVVHSDLLGMGCEAAAPSLERARDYVVVHPTEKALVLSVEICSATWYPASERDLEFVVCSALFGDAASAAIVGYSDEPRHPQLIDFESFYSPDYVDLLGYKWQNGMMKVVLSRRVPDIVPPLIAQTVDRLLDRNDLRREDVRYWMLHPGGKAVLRKMEACLGLTRDQTRYSWEVMRDYGNVSSATLGIIGKYLQQQERPAGWGVAATMGAGTAVNAILCRWE